jgi:predicted O-methyltransferase YrrM
MSAEELQWLYTTAMGMGTIVEVGSWRGRSTHALLSGTDGHVYAVDTWKGSVNETGGAHSDALKHNILAQFVNNLAGFKNLSVINLESIRAARCFDEKSIDMVFIDGCHLKEAVIEDLKAWMPVCKKLLCGHDFEMPEVKIALGTLEIEVENPVGRIWAKHL